MKRSKSIVGIAVGVSSIVLIVAGVIAHRSVQLLADTSDEILQSKELELSLERLLSSVRDAETGQRGYIVTGSEPYLFPYDAALREIDSRLSTVEVRMQARDGSVEEVQGLRQLVTLKLDELARTIELYRDGQRDQAIALVRSNEGQDGYGCHSCAGRRSRAHRTTQRRAPHGAGARCAAGHVAFEHLGQRARDTPHGRACLRGAARFRAPAAQRGTARDDVAQHRRRGDRDRRVWQRHDDQSDRRRSHRVASSGRQGKPLEEIFRIFNEQTREKVESPVTKVLREGGIVGLANHTVLIHRAGHETAIEDSGAPICDASGAITGVVLVFRDATEERAAKNALHLADRRKDEFLATLAHELRNPLAPIRQAAALAAHPGTNPEQLRWSLAVIERQTVHMARLLDDLLDVSRITRGRLEVRREPVDVAQRSGCRRGNGAACNRRRQT